MDPSLSVEAWEASVELWARDVFPSFFEPEDEGEEGDGTEEIPPYLGEP